MKATAFTVTTGYEKIDNKRPGKVEASVTFTGPSSYAEDSEKPVVKITGRRLEKLLDMMHELAIEEIGLAGYDADAMLGGENTPAPKSAEQLRIEDLETQLAKASEPTF